MKCSPLGRVNSVIFFCSSCISCAEHEQAREEEQGAEIQTTHD